MKKKVFNYSELHFSEGNFYKIHTLASWAKFKQDPKSATDKGDPQSLEISPGLKGLELMVLDEL